MLSDAAAEDTRTATKERVLLCSFSWRWDLLVNSVGHTAVSYCKYFCSNAAVHDARTTDWL